MTDPTAAVDYSRPVGWWCTYCEEDGPCFRERTCISMGCKSIPVYLPIPEGQRPLVEDEVTTGEAEVVTDSIGWHWSQGRAAGPQATAANATKHINYIVTGATE